MTVAGILAYNLILVRGGDDIMRDMRGNSENALLALLVGWIVIGTVAGFFQQERRSGVLGLAVVWVTSAGLGYGLICSGLLGSVDDMGWDWWPLMTLTFGSGFALGEYWFTFD